MIGAVETAIVARIKAAATPDGLGWTPKVVDSVGDRMRSDALLARALASLPAVWLAFRGEVPVEESHGGDKVVATWDLICVAQHRGNEVAARHGAGAAVGVYQMAEDLVALLARQDLGLEIEGGLAYGGMDLLLDTEIPAKAAEAIVKLSAAVLAVTFQATFRRSYGADAGANIGEFLTAHVDWDLPPFLDPAPEALPLAAGAGDSDQLVIIRET
jgi:phage gp37-like protein